MEVAGAAGGPGSTLAYVAIVNALKTRIAQLLTERGTPPAVITRASIVGAERSKALFDAAYREHARRVARTIVREPVVPCFTRRPNGTTVLDWAPRYPEGRPAAG